VRIALVGFGNVGRALARMLIRTHAPFTVTALGTKSHGAVVDAKGIDLAQILAGTDLPLRALPAMRDLPADILVEITTLDPKTGELVGTTTAEQTEQVFANINAVLRAAGVTLSNVVKTTVYLADMADFTQMNEVYAKHFAAHKPARSTVQAAGLPKNARVEIDVIAVKT